ncbi:MAG: hypothetical protein KGL63_02380 [Betaproteobacteria bacterium]|nr:hypothetical protein [Betaproteobacteria bacterium]
MSDPTKSEGKRPADKFIDVRVVTTAAIFPVEGYERVPDKQTLMPILHRAAAALGLTDTSGYIVTVNGNVVDPKQTYEALGLTGQVDLRWGPPAGGGG